jgi:hypothetical protein
MMSDNDFFTARVFMPFRVQSAQRKAFLFLTDTESCRGVIRTSSYNVINEYFTLRPLRLCGELFQNKELL